MDLSSDNSIEESLPTSTQHSAGGVVYRHHGREIDICLIKDSYGCWTFPKGHVEANENLEEAARREISEETGIEEPTLRLRRELGEVAYQFVSDFASDKSSGKSAEGPVQVHKYVTYYLFEVPFDTQLTAQAGEVEEIVWVPLAELDHYNEYEDNLPIVRRTKHYLNGLLL